MEAKKEAGNREMKRTEDGMKKWKDEAKEG